MAAAVVAGKGLDCSSAAERASGSDLILLCSGNRSRSALRRRTTGAYGGTWLATRVLSLGDVALP